MALEASRFGRIPTLGLLAVLVVGGLASAPAPAQGQDETAGTTEGLEQVEVELSSGVLKGVLPFDEPFLLTGTAPPDVVRIAGEWCYIDRQSADQLPSLLERFRRQGDIDRCPTSDPDEAQPVPLTPWVAPQGAEDASTFYLLVAQPLDPNRDFLFLFQSDRMLSTDELTAFQSAVRSGLDELFRSLERQQPPPASLDSDALRRLQERVRQILDGQPGASGSAEPSAGSVFDTATDLPAGTSPQWSEPFDAVYTMQVQQRTIEADRPQRVAALFRSLVALTPPAPPADGATAADASGATAGSALAALGAAIDGLSSDERSQLGHLLPAPALAAIDTLTEAPQTYLANVANGLASLDGTGWQTPGATAAAAPPDTWTPADLEPVADAWTSTRSALAALADLTRTAAQVDTLATALGPATVADLPALRQAVEDAQADAERLVASAARLEPILVGREQALDTLSSYLRRVARTEMPIVATSTGSFTTRAQNHVSGDIGVLYAGEIGQVLPYFGANFYTRPVNRDVPLSQYQGFAFRRRFSFMIGMTASSVEETAASGRVLRDNVFASSALVVGAGLRLTDSARVSVGALVLQENSPNPLVDDLELVAEPFLAFSIDWDVKSVLGQIGTSLFPGS